MPEYSEVKSQDPASLAVGPMLFLMMPYCLLSETGNLFIL